jgi:murein L,D-transpeptidase YcbB/YkuD
MSSWRTTLSDSAGALTLPHDPAQQWSCANIGQCQPTADAVIDFQAQYGLVVDGVFGPETDRSLSAAAASVAPGD